MSELSVPTAETMERNLLWAICLDNTAFFVAEQIVRPDDFYYTSHQTIYRAMGRLMEAQVPIDHDTVIGELERSGQIEAVGGAAFVYDLHTLLMGKGNPVAYARHVKEAANLRRLQKAAYHTALQADGQSGNFRVIRDQLEEHLLALGCDELEADGTREKDLDTLLERMERERSRPHDLLGLPSGLQGLDELTRGFQPGEITFCGASSGGGKSGFMVQAAIEALQRNVPTLLFSLEMDRAALHRRFLCALSGVPFPRIRDPKWAMGADMRRIREAAELLKQWPLHVVDKSALSIEQLVATARLYVRRHGVKLVAADYLQIIGSKERDERMRVSAVSRGLTRLAKDEQVPVLALSQLNRPDRREENRIPGQTSFRESSQIENDGHVLIIFHRERDQETGRLKSDGVVRIAKQRNGETADLPVRFDRATLTFSDSTDYAQRSNAA